MENILKKIKLNQNPFVCEHNKDPDECRCDCHKHPDAVHFMACCNICLKCGKRITIHAYRRHVENCKGVKIYETGDISKD